MATRDDRKYYLRPEDMDAEFMMGLVEGTTIPHREILDFTERKEHAAIEGKPSGAILRRVHTKKRSRRASIAGFADRSINLRDDQFREVMIEPFHIKNKSTYGPGDAGYALDAQGQATLDEADVVRAVDGLENARLNLVTEAILSMIDSKQFRYEDGQDLIITLSYAADIGDLPDAGSFPASNGTFDSADAEALIETRGAKAAYRAQPGIDFPFTMAFINPTTASYMMRNKQIKAIYQPFMPSDPDRTAETYDGFVFDGVTWIILHKTYTTAQGDLPAIADGYAVVMVPMDPKTGEKPIIWHSCQTIFNRNDASAAYYDTITEGEDPPSISPRMYDNGVPAPARRGLIARWKLYTPA